jgi:membrane associated rhomboid family serine protease
MARLRLRGNAPITLALLLLNGLIWLGQISPIGSLFTTQLMYVPVLTVFEPYRMLSAGFVHDPSGPLHILFNSYAIWIFGSQLEPLLGKVRFLALYLISIVGGSVVVLLLSDPRVPVVGASGAFFGLMGAYFVVLRSLGQNPGQLVLLIGMNLFLGFLVPGISWEGHLGGLITGAALGAVYTQARGKANSGASQLLGLLGVCAVLFALTWAKVQGIL